MRIQHIIPYIRKTGSPLSKVLLLGLLLGVSSCIEPYTADTGDEPKLISIEASLIKGASIQKVVITSTTSLNNPFYLPEKNCIVQVEDEMDNTFSFTESMGGTYVTTIPDEDLVEGRKYRLHIITQEGKEYESEFETLLAGVEVDTVYWKIENDVDALTGEELFGAQFYVDVVAPDTISRYYRWRIDETYEYTSVAPIDYYYMDFSLTPVIPDDIFAVYRCWITEEIPRIFLSTTKDIMVNEKKQIPLNYVSTETDRLRIKYSLLIRQYSISQEVYKYFEQNKTATEGDGSLYTRQPEQPLTNICNPNDDGDRVLGYFWTSSMTQTRIFVTHPEELDVDINWCPVEPLDMEVHKTGPFPMAIIVNKATGERFTGSLTCFDCTRRGGSTTPPSFWE